MSDLYIELVSRIPVVSQKAAVGSQLLEDAQKRSGLSNEAVARRIYISERTWRRWKEDGEIPKASAQAVAEALSLEMRELVPPEEPAQLAAVPDEPASSDEIRELREMVAEQGEVLRAMAAELRGLRRAQEGN